MAVSARGSRPRPRRVPRVRRIPAAKRYDVTREEFNRTIALLNERGDIVNVLRHNQEIQFKRIAQLQAELDHVKGLLEKLVFGGR